ncbi:MAG: prolyl oligopeptidase family serine peptidase [Bacteroidales bacterium]
MRYVFLEARESNNPEIAYLATYIWADQWITTTLEIKSPHMLKAWINGEVIGTKNTTESDEGTVGRVSKDLTLERGKHLLVIKTVKPADARLDWKIMANMEIKEPWTLSDLDISLSPVNRKNIDHILDGVKTSAIEPSHDGKYYSVSFSRSLPPSDQSERWTEIRRTEDGKLMHSFRHAQVSRMNWLPNSNRISYVNTRGDKATLFLHDIENGEITEVMDEMENFSGYTWAPDESFIIYYLREEDSSTDTDIRRVIGMQDRQGHFRHRSFLYQFTLESGLHRRLTFGNLTTSLQDISPDSKHILFSQSYPDYTERPFSKQNMFILNLNNLTLDTLWMNESRGVRARFSPDGNYLLAAGGPSSFDDAGLNVPDSIIPNNSDTQAFIYNIQDGSVNAFTKEFNPSVASVYWHEPDDMIYMVTVDMDFRRLYRYDVRRDRISLVELELDYISSASFADNARIAIISASQTNEPSRHYTLNLSNMRKYVLEDTEAEIYKHVEFGEVKNWDFTASTGVEVKGRVYYPPDFNAENTYPVIVYYYAGTTPVGRTFGGRYPFNIWAGSGYIVYVLQPSGATGFGQEFSAAHVNNWGTTVADEIIEGAKKFLESHPYTKADKVGCAGASYGGFMTMLLMTRTDIFTAAISHAGISSISSYWGEGYWGYAYSSEASAESYPWNNHDLYVEQSPLFHADKIVTPLLLLTGDSDTNVPPGESIQLYTALKILDRPVELVMVKDQDHHILNYSKRKQWHNVIMAWWDKHLKDQGEWWKDQFPEKNY